MSVKTMTCMTCAKTKAWPDGFPNRIEATCWQCAWNEHLRGRHPHIVRKVQRDVRRRAKARAQREEMQSATDNELQILTGILRPKEQA